MIQVRLDKRSSYLKGCGLKSLDGVYMQTFQHVQSPKNAHEQYLRCQKKHGEITIFQQALSLARVFKHFRTFGILKLRQLFFSQHYPSIFHSRHTFRFRILLCTSQVFEHFGPEFVFKSNIVGRNLLTT